MKTLTLLFIVALVVALLVPGIDGKVSAGKKQKIKTAAKVAKVKATTKASTKVKAATATHVAAAPCDCTTPDVQAAIRVQCDPKQMEAIISGATPGMMQPGMMQPGMTQPGMMQPGMTQPGMMQPGVMQPGMMQPGMPQGPHPPIVQGQPVFIEESSLIEKKKTNASVATNSTKGFFSSMWGKAKRNPFTTAALVGGGALAASMAVKSQSPAYKLEGCCRTCSGNQRSTVDSMKAALPNFGF